VVGIDPGRTIGVAYIDVTASALKVLHASQETHPPVVGRLLREWGGEAPEVVVEDFVGAGPRNTASNHTLKVIGFIVWHCELLHLQVTQVPPQSRLSAVTAAKQFKCGPHATDAMAHAIAYARRRW